MIEIIINYITPLINNLGWPAIMIGMLFIGLGFLSGWYTYVLFGQIPSKEELDRMTWMTSTWKGGKHIWYFIITIICFMTAVAFFLQY